jgi:TonB family protein
MRLGLGDWTVNGLGGARAAVLVAGVLIAGSGIAADEAATGSTVGATEAKIKGPAVHPAYPYSGLMNGREGWVEFSFVVRPDGTVADPIVENSSGYPEFERAALKALMRQAYEPATFNGKPIEQCATKQRYKFMIAAPPGARRSFVTSYKEAVQLFDNKQFTEAEAYVDTALRDGVWNLYESSSIYLLRSEIQAAQGDRAGQLQSLIRAEGGNLEPKKLAGVLKVMFSLQLSQQKFADALETRQRLRKLEEHPAPGDPVERAAAQIDALLASPQPIAFPGTVEYRSGCVEGRANFQYPLLRKKFAISDIKGKAPDLEIRCDRKRFVDSVSEEKMWAVPDSWGKCQVFVFGDDGTTLKIIEYPAEVAATQ